MGAGASVSKDAVSSIKAASSDELAEACAQLSAQELDRVWAALVPSTPSTTSLAREITSELYDRVESAIESEDRNTLRSSPKNARPVWVACPPADWAGAPTQGEQRSAIGIRSAPKDMQDRLDSQIFRIRHQVLRAGQFLKFGVVEICNSGVDTLERVTHFKITVLYCDLR